MLHLQKGEPVSRKDTCKDSAVRVTAPEPTTQEHRFQVGLWRKGEEEVMLGWFVEGILWQQPLVMEVEESVHHRRSNARQDITGGDFARDRDWGK
jgi:hypothetical protein